MSRKMNVFHLLVPSLLLSLLINLPTDPSAKWVVRAQSSSAQFDGFVYGKKSEFNPGKILIEAFFDPVCPDSRDAWPPLKQALNHYASHVSLTVHPFPLPYHDNAFVTSRALHIVDGLNSSATYPLWETFFKTQEKFYNSETANISKSEVVDRVAKVAAKVAGQSHYSAIKSGFKDRNSDLKTRVSFKYGCSRGVFGTPFFYVNGFLLPDGGSPIDYNGWRKIIDPLIKARGGRIYRPM
ncbi:uncharacterized protein LOC141586565 [Silene latifolia]|uniref:uncharacterized protein LOC141586565 n=1 Tax=Silene latifolia TaxID=37657 RepID=UPI003D78386B